MTKSKQTAAGACFVEVMGILIASGDLPKELREKIAACLESHGLVAGEESDMDETEA